MPVPCVFLVPSADSPGGVAELGDCSSAATCVATVHGITMNLCDQCACHIGDTGDDNAKVVGEIAYIKRKVSTGGDAK